MAPTTKTKNKSKTTPVKTDKKTKTVVTTKTTDKAKKTKPKKVAKKTSANPVVKKKKIRSKAYLAAKAKVDVNKYYPLIKAIDLVKDTSISKFDGKVEAHIVTSQSPGKIGDITFPHLETKSKKVVVVTDKIIKDIQAGKIDFDILISTPAFMPKVIPLARVLGPKGLMPNPKNGTISDKPEETAKKLAAAPTSIHTEKKAPLIHIVVGKISQPSKQIQANVKTLIKLITPAKIKKLVLCATMGPSVKVKL